MSLFSLSNLILGKTVSLYAKQCSKIVRNIKEKILKIKQTYTPDKRLFSSVDGVGMT